jgi:hypothetical protein
MSVNKTTANFLHALIVKIKFWQGCLVQKLLPKFNLHHALCPHCKEEQGFTV